MSRGTEQAIAEVGRVSSMVRGMRAIVDEDEAREVASRKPRHLRLVVPQNGSLRDADAPAIGAAS